MTEQFDRVVNVQVDTIKIGELDASFRVVKTLKKAPNTCELTLYNLNADHREQLAQAENPTVEISAGYKRPGSEGLLEGLQEIDALLGTSGPDPGTGVIFRGDVRDVSSNYEPPDWATLLESGDGERLARASRINKSFAQGTSLATVLVNVADATGFGIGNTALAAPRASLLNAGKAFLNGVTVSGQASKEMDRIVKSSGLEWSVQDGNLQLLGLGEPLLDSAVILSDDSGLVGSPTIGNDGVVRITALMNSDIVPGRLIVLNSKAIKGKFRAERCEYIGSVFDRPFYVEIEAKEL
jgi:hypothetical protein